MSAVHEEHRLIPATEPTACPGDGSYDADGDRWRYVAARSYLFVPGDRSDMLAKAVGKGPDAVIADLEDAVHPRGKEAARHVTADWLAGESPVERWVRVNSGDIMQADVATIGPALPDGILLPKVRTATDIDVLAVALDEAGATSLPIVPLIETAMALFHLLEIASADGVARLMIGEIDLAADLGLDENSASTWLPIRLDVVAASAAAGIDAPIAPVSPAFNDPDRFLAETRELLALGFGSRAAIHPRQIEPIHAALTPDTAKVVTARNIIAVAQEAAEHGRGVVRGPDGDMIDEAVVRQARRIMDAARRAGIA